MIGVFLFLRIGESGCFTVNNFDTINLLTVILNFYYATHDNFE